MRSLEERRSLGNDVLEALRTAIVTGELVPGSLHSVHSLATQLGVSRTPVREALLQLAAQSMVRFERNRGIRILQTTAHDLEEIMSLRLLLEVPATYRAVTQLVDSDAGRLRRAYLAMLRAAEADDERTLMERDREFHSILLVASGNRRLARFVDSLRDLVLTRGASTAGQSRTLHDIVDEHRPILEMAERRDAAGAAAFMRDHIMRTMRLLLAQDGAAPPTGLAWPSWHFEGAPLTEPATAAKRESRPTPKPESVASKGRESPAAARREPPETARREPPETARREPPETARREPLAAVRPKTRVAKPRRQSRSSTHG